MEKSEIVLWKVNEFFYFLETLQKKHFLGQQNSQKSLLTWSLHQVRLELNESRVRSPSRGSDPKVHFGRSKVS